MITSIVQLPEFAKVGTTVIDGTTTGGIYPSSIMANVQRVQTQMSGRKFLIFEGLSKYKVRVLDMYGKICDIVFATLDPIDLNDLRSCASVEIFPLYLRENPCMGYSSHFLSSIILNVASINRMFNSISNRMFSSYLSAQIGGTPGQVCSLQYVFNYALKRMSSDISHIPDWILDNKADLRYATLSPIPDTTMTDFLYGENGAGDRLRETANKSCVPIGLVTGEIESVFNATNMWTLAMLLDCNHLNSLIELSIRSAVSDYATYFSLIHNHHPPYESTYISRSASGKMDRLLYCESLLKTQDFSVNLRTGLGRSHMAPPNGCGLDVNFDISNFQIQNYNILEMFNLCVRYETAYTSLEAEYSPLRVTGSYLEDLWVYNNEGELVAYIDLVWWIVAAGAGLINISSVCID